MRCFNSIRLEYINLTVQTMKTIKIKIYNAIMQYDSESKKAYGTKIKNVQ